MEESMEQDEGGIMDLRKWERVKAWCYMYLSEHMTADFAEFHDDWFKSLESDRTAIASPRFFGKSYVFSFFYVLYCLLEEDGGVLCLSDAASLAESFLGKVKRELLENKLLIADYGDQAGDVRKKVWRNDEINLENGNWLVAKGRTGAVRGLHPKLVVVDDLENDELVLNEDSRGKLDKWFWSDLIPMVPLGGQVVVVGTLLHPLSFLSSLVTEGKDGWVTRIDRALEDGKSVWENMWPTVELLKRKAEMGSLAFEQEYMNNPIPDGARLFTKDMFRYYEKVPIGCRYFTTVDPARTVKMTSDYTAIITCAMDAEKNVYVVEASRGRWKPSEVVKEIFRHYEMYSPECIGVEYVGLNEWLKSHLDNESENKRLYPYFKELKLDVSEKGQKKRYRIESMQPWFEKGKVKLNKKCGDLESELLTFPSGKHDDLCTLYGTLIHTNKGDVLIQDIIVGDMVLTRKGFQRVLVSKKTGHELCINKFGLKATPDHPVWTTNGFKSLATISFYDTLMVCESQLHGMGMSITDIQSLKKEITGSISKGTAQETQIIFIGIFGKVFMVKSQSVMLFITLMDVLRTTILKTLVALNPMNIKKCIGKKVRNVCKTKDFKKRLDLDSMNGKKQQRGRNGGVLKKEECQETQQTSLFAKIVIKHFKMLVQTMTTFVRLDVLGGFLKKKLDVILRKKRNLLEQGNYKGPMDHLSVKIAGLSCETLHGESITAAQLAKKSAGIKKDTSQKNERFSLKNVLFVERLFLVTGWQLNSVLKNVHKQEQSSGSVTGDVYNLTIETANEYFADGLLVHNCDALASQFEIMTPGEPTKESVPSGSFLEYWNNVKHKEKRKNYKLRWRKFG